MRALFYGIIAGILISPQLSYAQSAAIIETFAGGGPDYPGDGGPATMAELGGVVNIHIDAQGNAYIVDWSDDVIQKVDTAGIISTFAGTRT